MRPAILVTYDRDEAVGEALSLCEAAGYRADHVMRQSYLMRSKYGVSEEVVERLEKEAAHLSPEVIIYDELLRPSQNYNLASRLHMNILDRESLILEIFEGRASSAESKLQVKLAQMRYEMGRAREKVRLAKLGEQPGFMGIGKFEVDAYHDDIRHRMQSVKKKLEKAGKQRELHRQGRRRQGLRTVSLAGYTSAGKTTLFNALTGEAREEDPGLFTTLSTTVRRMEEGGRPVLLSDTVGFIGKLPAYMIDAFRSTLEELLYADLVVVLVDIADEPARLQKKFQSCSRTLADLGVDPDRIVYALNKADRIDTAELESRRDGLDLGRARHVAVSARTGEGLPGLRSLIAGSPGRAGPEIEVLRIGQRAVRDDRVTTHVALVARAMGASRIYMDEVNPDIRGTIEAVNETWGGSFELVTTDSWRRTLKERIAEGFAPVHLTMYGQPVQEAAPRIAAEPRVIIVVGAEKVPREVYDMARYNVAVSSQPHSEIGALAVLLDRMQGRAQFEAGFAGARRAIVPSGTGKQVVPAKRD